MNFMRGAILGLSFSVVMLASALPAGAQEPAPPPPAAPVTSPPQTSQATPNQIVIPAGTHLPLQLQNSISTRGAKPGDAVYFQTTFPIVQNDRVAIPVGSYVSGEITQIKRPGRVHGKAELMVRLTTLILPNAYQVRFDAVPSSSGTTRESVNSEGKVIGPSNTKGDAGTVIRTTGEGAIIGAIAGRSGSSAGIGAGAGAAAGLLGVLLTRGPEAELPRGTTLDAVLDRPLYLDGSKINFADPGPARSFPVPPDRESRRVRPR